MKFYLIFILGTLFTCMSCAQKVSDHSVEQKAISNPVVHKIQSQEERIDDYLEDLQSKLLIYDVHSVDPPYYLTKIDDNWKQEFISHLPNLSNLIDETSESYQRKIVETYRNSKNSRNYFSGFSSSEYEIKDIMLHLKKLLSISEKSNLEDINSIISALEQMYLHFKSSYYVLIAGYIDDIRVKSFLYESLSNPRFNNSVVEVSLARMEEPEFHQKYIDLFDLDKINPAESFEQLKEWKNYIEVLSYIGTKDAIMTLSKGLNRDMLYGIQSHGDLKAFYASNVLYHLRFMIDNQEFQSIFIEVDQPYQGITNDKTLARSFPMISEYNLGHIRKANEWIQDNKDHLEINRRFPFDLNKISSYLRSKDFNERIMQSQKN